MPRGVLYYLDKIITTLIDLTRNTKEQVWLLNKSNNKTTNVEKEKEQQTNFTPIFQQNTQPRVTKHGILYLTRTQNSQYTCTNKLSEPR